MARLSPDQKRELLAKVPIFAGLAPKELDALVEVARTVSVPAREEVFHQRDAGTQFFLIVEGKAKALATSTDGDDIVFDILGPGEVFGEIALFCENQRTATVTTIDPCEFLVLDRRDFLTFVKRYPDFALHLLELMAARLRNLSEFTEDTLFLNLPIRLAKKLSAFARSYGATDGSATRIDVKLSQEEWGDLVGATRESVNKQLREWSEQGLIRLEKGYVVIQKLEELERLGSRIAL